jgi:UDP-GlcNAc:undecaprenyl-phosphate GlcNAc-1-phosphate transferase
MNWIVSAALVPSFVLSFAGCFVVRRAALWWGLVDRPGHRKVHSAPVPYGGGLAIWAAMCLSLLAGYLLLLGWQPSAVSSDAAEAPAAERLSELVATHRGGLLSQASSVAFLLAAASVLLVVGLVDDARRLDWRLRLLVQFAVAALTVWWQGWKLTLFVDLPLLTDVISILWIVGLVNSFNFLDNMDGLAGGVGAIAAVLLAIYMLLVPEAPGQPQLFIAGFLFLLVGALVGFLLHNRPPARLFMGDAGSYFLGYCLAVMTALATFSGPDVPRHSILAPLFVLAVPLYDTASVVLIRLRAGRSPFEGDTNHLSHRLVALGLNKGQAVLTIYLMCAACGLGALVLPQVNTAGALIVATLVGCLLGVIAILETSARRLTRP